jgi:hypothetical protein
MSSLDSDERLKRKSEDQDVRFGENTGPGLPGVRENGEAVRENCLQLQRPQ